MAHFQEIIELRRTRANLVSQMNEVIDLAANEKRELTKDEEEKWDRLVAEEEEIRKKVDRLETLEDRNKAISESEKRAKGGNPDAGNDKKDEYRSSFDKWVRGGMEYLSPEERTILRTGWVSEETRALSATTGTAGGYTVPSGFYDSLIEAMKWYGGMRNVANIISTDAGNPLPIPTTNDTMNIGEILPENQQAASQDVPFGQITLNAYKFSSKIVLVPIELLQDSAFDVESYLTKILGTRIARINNQLFTTGTGTSQPQGVVTASNLGKTGLTGQTTAVIYDDLIDLEHSVDIAYRQNAKFMFHDQTLKALKKLKDGYGRPLWLPGIAVKEPDTINGYSYQVNNDMAQMAANAKSILFGDFSNYWIRDVKSVQIIRFNEKFMDSGQVGFLAFSRADGKAVDAGMHPIAYYANSAT